MRRGDPRAVLAGLALVAAVGLLDYLTPVDVDFGLFYMLALLLVAWFAGWRAGLVFAVLAAVTEFAVDAALRAPTPATAAWNGFSRFVVLSAMAAITDRLYLEREHWQRVHAERDALLRVLDRELPRPLRSIEWFVRTFEEVLEREPMEGLRMQFAALRHHVREVGFLTTDVLAVGHLHSGALGFERQPLDLREVAREAVDETLDRGRLILRLTPEPLPVLADRDRLRHAVASVVGRSLEVSPYDTVSVRLRASSTEAVVEIDCRGRVLVPADVELAQLLIEGNGGRLTLVTRSGRQGTLTSILLPLVERSPSQPTNSSAAILSSRD